MKVVFTPLAFAKLKAYIEGTPFEISGFGKVTKTADTLTIEDIKIFPQTVTSGNTKMDAQVLAQFWDDLIVAGEDMGKWKLWWHSHVWMETVFSKTDIDTIDGFDNDIDHDNWILSIVANKRGQAYAQIDIFQPFRCTLHRLPIEKPTGELPIVDVAGEIAEKVKTPQYSPRTHILWDEKQKQLQAMKQTTLLSEEQQQALREVLRKQLALALREEPVVIVDPDGNVVVPKN